MKGITNATAKFVFKEVFLTGKNPRDIVEENNLWQITDVKEIESIIDKVIINCPKEVSRFVAGEEKIIGFLIGKIMKESNNRIDGSLAEVALKVKISIPEVSDGN